MFYGLAASLKTTFAKDDSGAVTVDWVVLTAAVVVLAAGVAAILGSGEGGIIETLRQKIADAISGTGTSG